MSPFRQSAGPDLAPGRYLGRVRSIEERTSERYGSDFLIWHCEAAAGGAIEEVSGTSSTAWSPQSKAYQWASAIVGERLDPRSPVAFETIVDRRVVLVVAPNDRDWPTVVDMEPFGGEAAGLVPFGPSAVPTTRVVATPSVAAFGSAPRPLDSAPVGAWPTTSAAPATPEPPVAPRPTDDLPF